MYTLFNFELDWNLNYFKDLFHTFFQVAKHKTFEFQIYFTLIQFFRINVNYTTKRDHAGLTIILALLGFNFVFSICDNRHWDDEKDTWCVYDDVSVA